MADKKKNDGFFDGVNKFFKRVGNQDLITLGGGNKINIFNSPQSKDELKQKQELQVFRQFLQSKNWSNKHNEFYDEYRRMDATFPIINAALRLYSQEVCISGDSIVTLPKGDFTVKSLYEHYKERDNAFFLVQSYDVDFKRTTWAECGGIVNNGIKPVYEVTVQRLLDEYTAPFDTKLEAKFKCTDNHLIMIPDNQYKQLKDLKIGDQIFSLAKNIDPSCGCPENKFLPTIITSIEYVGEEEVFDLINVAPYHNFSLKLTDRFHVFVHNCNKDAEGNVFRVITDDKDVKRTLNECFFDNLKLDSRSYLYVRSMLQFGNLFGFLETRRGVGVTDIISLPPEAIRIMLEPNSDRLDQFKYNWYGYGQGINFDPWEIVHWKIIENIEHEPYGQSILRSIVDTWRRIVLMREALVIYRITRAPQRFLFKIDTTGLDPDAAARHAENMKKSLHKKSLINPVTGEIDAKFNALSILEDFYMPTYEGDVGDVRVLEGASNLDAVEDYKIIKDDLFAGLLIPKSFLTFEEDLSNKAALCLRHDTVIKTTEGSITIKELSDIFENDKNKKIYVVSCNDYGLITDGKVLWCKSTKEVNQLYRIHLSNNKYHDTTDNHPFLLETMVYRRADELKVGDAIKNIYGKEILVSKIEIIELDTTELVYDLEVEKHHNFALDSGIFVHNSQEDLRFNNAVKQYQSYYIEGLLHIALVHLYMNGYGKDELESFHIEMNGSSTLAEKTKNELLEQRINLAKSALDNSSGISVMSYTQVLKEILKFTDEEIATSFNNQLIENKMIWRLNQIRENGTYQEPDAEKKKANMRHLEKDIDVFKELQFESKSVSETMPVVESILSKKIDEEIKMLTKGATKRPTKKMIDEVVSLQESKVSRNIKKTFVDLGIKKD